MLIKTDGNRKAAYDSVINHLIKDPTVYCNNCGFRHKSRIKIDFICCDDPQVGNNADHIKAVIKQNKHVRSVQINQYASNDKKNFRYGISMPKCIYESLDNYEKMLSTQEEPGRRLFKTDDDIRWFAKNYPQFAIPERM